MERDENISIKIAKKIDYLFSNPSIRDEMSNKGIKRVKEKYSSNDYITKLFEIIND